MAGRHGGVFEVSAVVEKPDSRGYGAEEVKALWSGLYDRLMQMDDKAKCFAGWKDLRSTLIKAYDLAVAGQWELSVKMFGAQVKGLIVHLSLIEDAFGKETPLEGEALEVLMKCEIAEEQRKESLFAGVFE